MRSCPRSLPKACPPWSSPADRRSSLSTLLPSTPPQASPHLPRSSPISPHLPASSLLVDGSPTHSPPPPRPSPSHRLGSSRRPHPHPHAGRRQAERGSRGIPSGACARRRHLGRRLDGRLAACPRGRRLWQGAAAPPHHPRAQLVRRPPNPAARPDAPHRPGVPARARAARERRLRREAFRLDGGAPAPISRRALGRRRRRLGGQVVRRAHSRARPTRAAGPHRPILDRSQAPSA